MDNWTCLTTLLNENKSGNSDAYNDVGSSTITKIRIAFFIGHTSQTKNPVFFRLRGSAIGHGRPSVRGYFLGFFSYFFSRSCNGFFQKIPQRFIFIDGKVFQLLYQLVINAC